MVAGSACNLLFIHVFPKDWRLPVKTGTDVHHRRLRTHI